MTIFLCDRIKKLSTIIVSKIKNQKSKIKNQEFQENH